MPSLSPVASRLLARAYRELDAGDAALAQRTLDAVAALAPQHPELARCSGYIAEQRGDYLRVIDCFRDSVGVWPRDANLHMSLGAALFAAGSTVAGLAELRLACELAPGSAHAWTNLGAASLREGHAREAIAALERAVELDPAAGDARLTLARACAAGGDTGATVRQLRAVLAREPANARAWFGLANLNVSVFTPADTMGLQELFDGAAPATLAHELVGFALGRSLEEQGEYVAAFDVFEAVNRVRARRYAWDAVDARRRAAAIREAFASGPERMAGLARGREMILIAGLPRSGATLVEQILTAHPTVAGANELQALPELIEQESQRRHETFPGWVAMATTGDWERLGAAYLEQARRWRGGRARCTDKNLANWYLAGAALTMLPAARVVIVRRDPLETCLACFRQRLDGDAGFTCDLDDMVDYCADFLGLTRFWLERCPQRVFDLEYEALVANPERVIRALLAFCDLPFDPACVAFERNPRAVLSAQSAAQVRAPLRLHTARASRYGDRLDGVRAHLRRVGLMTATA